ncbi:hypothetical protein AN958_05411 [Leucoagaricus sp. SymC.cos]|nr:hypothetical protein AN958_05411 [Leucoagaricus sp. SymC.cos]
MRLLLSSHAWDHYEQDQALVTSHVAHVRDDKPLDSKTSSDVARGSDPNGTEILLISSQSQAQENTIDYSDSKSSVQGPASQSKATQSGPPLEVAKESISKVSSDDAVPVESISPGQDEEFHPKIRTLVAKDTLTKEALVQMTPMKPKKETVLPGYNPKLDEKRPQEMKEYLKTYRILLVIDDSVSMKIHWNETRDALEEISNHALELYSDALEIRFFNNLLQREGIKGVDEVNDIFDLVRPSPGTPTGRVLAEVLKKQIDRLDKAQRSGRYSSERPLDIIVLTDGVPNSNSPPAPVIAAAAARLRNSKHHPNCIGIQFVQIGNNPAAEPTLLSLIDGPNNDMVDTISYSFYKSEGNGRLTTAVLNRIILGGLHSNLRAYWNQYRQKKHEKTSKVFY